MSKMSQDNDIDQDKGTINSEKSQNNLKENSEKTQRKIKTGREMAKFQQERKEIMWANLARAREIRKNKIK